jgi:hypothetical protein
VFLSVGLASLVSDLLRQFVIGFRLRSNMSNRTSVQPILRKGRSWDNEISKEMEASSSLASLLFSICPSWPRLTSYAAEDDEEGKEGDEVWTMHHY